MTFSYILQIIIGFVGLIVIAIPFSENIKTINYRYIIFGIFAQIFLALILLKAPLVTDFFIMLGNGVNHSSKCNYRRCWFCFWLPSIR